MRLPLIKHITQFANQRDEDFILEAIEMLEHVSESSSVKEEELEVIGEMLSNMYGALEVQKMIEQGQSEKEALNGFMKRVMGSIN